MKTLQLDLTGMETFAGLDTALRSEACKALDVLKSGSGEGSDFLGWLSLPEETTPAFLADIQDTAAWLREQCDYVVSIGIGGSYLGARAVIEALSDCFDVYRHPLSHPVILYAGNHISEDYLHELVRFLRGKRFGIINISKSGTTTEPAIAFRLLKSLLEEQVGVEQARRLIVAVTDAKKGALRTLADQEDYKTYIIPDNVGGRFSVLTPVGLLPIAVAGFDIAALVRGACDMMPEVLHTAWSENPALRYAAARHALYRAGKKIEILGNFHPKLHYIAEWWKQLFGESEGKQHSGLFNAAVDLTTDLHSMGQWIQDGERTIFETILSVAEPDYCLSIPTDEKNLDGLNFLAGKRIDEVNKMAELGTRMAHVDGGVPNIRIVMPRLDEYHIGSLFYFFEVSVGISGYMLRVNPFNQPGVEAYKNNMFALLGKPGYEKESTEILKRI